MSYTIFSEGDETHAHHFSAIILYEIEENIKASFLYTPKISKPEFSMLDSTMKFLMETIP